MSELLVEVIIVSEKGGNVKGRFLHEKDLQEMIDRNAPKK
jgi:hypothetical protein